MLHAEASRSPTTSRQALEKIKLRQLHLQQNELFEEGTRQVMEARQLPMRRCIMEAQRCTAGLGFAVQRDACGTESRPRRHRRR